MDLSTLVHLAQWFERRVDATVDFDLPASRLYGLVLNDPHLLADERLGRTAARASFVAEDVDVYRLIDGPAGVIARSFDAAAVVSSGWAAPTQDGQIPPSRHPERRRLRVVAVVSDAGVRSVTRFADSPSAPVVMTERGAGGVIDTLEALWFGDPFALLGRGGQGRSASRSCRRHT